VCVSRGAKSAEKRTRLKPIKPLETDGHIPLILRNRKDFDQAARKIRETSLVPTSFVPCPLCLLI
jgi:hypothetical protein